MDQKKKNMILLAIAGLCIVAGIGFALRPTGEVVKIDPALLKAEAEAKAASSAEEDKSPVQQSDGKRRRVAETQ